MDIKKQLDPDNYRIGRESVKYIVIHDTGNFNDTAKGNANYFCSGKRKSSAHYFVDEDSIVQLVEDSNTAWHVGDGKGKYGITNSNSIGIEMCKTNGTIGPFTYNKTLELTRMLCNKYNVPYSNVTRHYDASRKNCPASFSQNNWQKWNQFKNDLILGTFEAKLDSFVKRGIISSPQYWIENAREGKICKGEYVRMFISNYCAKPIEVALNHFKSKGLISTVEGWQQEEIKGEYVRNLIEKLRA